MEVRSRALVEDTDPKARQVVPSVAYSQVPLPVLAVMATPLRSLVSSSDMLALVSIVDTAVAEDVVFSLVVVRL